MATWKTWHHPLSADQAIIEDVERDMRVVGAGQQEVPLLVQLIENPKYQIPGLELFHGAVDLETHDIIHILLGRGLLPKDEAFTIGFTMGSTYRVSALEETLFQFFAKNLYPKYYRFDEEDLEVFRDALRLGYISDCMPLDQLVCENLRSLTVAEGRARLGIETDLLRAYYQIERRRYPQSAASQRLLA
jgi:hypothetical protein